VRCAKRRRVWSRRMRCAGVAALMCDCVACRAAVSCERASGSDAAQSRPLRWASHSRAAVTRRVSACGARRSCLTASFQRALVGQCGKARTSVASRLSSRAPRSRHRSPPRGRISEQTLGLWAQPTQHTVLVRCVRGRAL
jgi:hypothetical protein